MFKEFRDFAARGNVIDLAVGVIIGVAFGKIVTSLVNDVIMPPIGMALGRISFKDFFVSLNGPRYGRNLLTFSSGLSKVGGQSGVRARGRNVCCSVRFAACGSLFLADSEVSKRCRI